MRLRFGYGTPPAAATVGGGGESPAPELSDIFTRTGQTTALGVWSGTDEADDFETWLGAAVDLVDKHADRSSWGGMATSISDFGTLNAAADQAIVWSIPPMLSSGTTLAAAAAGSYNSNYDTIAAAVLAAHNKPSGPILIRTGWEQNGDWQPWAAQDSTNGDYFKAMWVHFVTRFRAASNRFKFIWCPNQGQADPDLSWPGAAYVDLIGMDVYYNAGSNAGDGTGYFGFIKTDTYGLDWLVAKGATESLPICIPEWGVKASQGANVGEPGPATETSTQAPYVALFCDWMHDNGVFYSTYWDSNLDIDTKLSSGQYPLTGAEFKKWFGAPEITNSATGNLVGDEATTLSLEITTTATINSISLTDNADGFGTSGVNLTLAAQEWIDSGDNTRTVTVTALGWRGLTDSLAYTLTITEPITDLYPGYDIAFDPVNGFYKYGAVITNDLATFLGAAGVTYDADPTTKFSASGYNVATATNTYNLRLALTPGSAFTVYVEANLPAAAGGNYHGLAYLAHSSETNTGLGYGRDGYNSNIRSNCYDNNSSIITPGNHGNFGSPDKAAFSVSPTQAKWFFNNILKQTQATTVFATKTLDRLVIAGHAKASDPAWPAAIKLVLVNYSTDADATVQAWTT